MVDIVVNTVVDSVETMVDPSIDEAELVDVSVVAEISVVPDVETVVVDISDIEVVNRVVDDSDDESALDEETVVVDAAMVVVAVVVASVELEDTVVVCEVPVDGISDDVEGVKDVVTVVLEASVVDSELVDISVEKVVASVDRVFESVELKVVYDPVEPAVDVETVEANGVMVVPDREYVFDRARGAAVFLRISLDFSPHPESATVSKNVAADCNI